MTCADAKYMEAVKCQFETAYKYGRVDKTLFYNIDEIATEFAEKNQKILNSGGQRRKGCYLWKPYFINKALDSIQLGDFLIYLDAAGCCYRSRVSECIRYMEKKQLEIVGKCSEKYREGQWTKRDAFVIMGCDEPRFWNQFQRYGGFLVLKKTERTIAFLQEWLEWCQNYYVISDCPNIMGKENVEGFVEHRYDQSILSILMGKYKIPYIEKMPIPCFCLYHHSMEKSLKNIQRRRRKEFHSALKDYFIKMDVGGMAFVVQNYIHDCYWYQKVIHPFELFFDKYKLRG